MSIVQEGLGAIRVVSRKGSFGREAGRRPAHHTSRPRKFGPPKLHPAGQ